MNNDDYLLVADAIAASKPRIVRRPVSSLDLGADMQYAATAVSIATFFEMKDPAFNRKNFLEHAGVRS